MIAHEAFSSQNDQQEAEWSSWSGSYTYQIYPSTFHEDSKREPQRGIGSLKGIIDKLDYIRGVGYDAIWLSPFYPSPGFDGGYDITSATDVDEKFGTMGDMDELIGAVHERGMKVMIDFIPNHTSDAHPWFLDSSSSRDSEKNDWYVWADPVFDSEGNRHPPNNWGSVFSLPQLDRRTNGEFSGLGPNDPTPSIPAWTWNHARGQYYLHSFGPFQPDLNWDNPAVRDAMQGVMRFWLDKGVDGLRVDAANYIGKNITRDENGKLIMPDELADPSYQEGKDNPYDQLQRHNSCGYPPTLLKHLHEITSVLNESAYKGRDTRIIFEAYMKSDELCKIDEIDPKHASTFNFSALKLPWEAGPRKKQLDEYHKNLQSGGIANYENGNHDKPRLATRLGDNAARAIAVYTLLQPNAMVFTYNGEELGLTDGIIPNEDIKDPSGLRDPARMPIPWDDTLKNDGFSRADPASLYLPLNPNDHSKSVRIQSMDELSSLALYRAAIALGRRYEGSYTSLQALVDNYGENDGGVIAYGRSSKEVLMTVLANTTPSERLVRLSERDRQVGRLVLSSCTVEQQAGNPIDLRRGVMLKPNEAIAILHTR